jgi:D-glycero-alpha-D-manno-heptose 1-phosphate guanylyltransferase
MANEKNNLGPFVMLAGGFGTRLRHLIGDLPKSMAPISGKPFFQHMFDYLILQGVQEVILAAGFRNEVIREYFGTTYGALKLTYYIEPEPLGTGGAVRGAFAFVEDGAFVSNGDSFFGIDLSALKKFYDESHCDIALSLKRLPDTSRYGRVTLGEDNRITAFSEKRPGTEGLINGGLYYFSKKLYGKISVPEVFSFEKDVLEKYVSTLAMRGKVFDDYFIDIGIPEDYERAQHELPAHIG